eukprot:635765-Rhodomonas_salina.2
MSGNADNLDMLVELGPFTDTDLDGFDFGDDDNGNDDDNDNGNADGNDDDAAPRGPEVLPLTQQRLFAHMFAPDVARAVERMLDSNPLLRHAELPAMMSEEDIARFQQYMMECMERHTRAFWAKYNLPDGSWPLWWGGIPLADDQSDHTLDYGSETPFSLPFPVYLHWVKQMLALAMAADPAYLARQPHGDGVDVGDFLVYVHAEVHANGLARRLEFLQFFFRVRD